MHKANRLASGWRTPRGRRGSGTYSSASNNERRASAPGSDDSIGSTRAGSAGAFLATFPDDMGALPRNRSDQTPRRDESGRENPTDSISKALPCKELL
jgi:hypothetical protein